MTDLIEDVPVRDRLAALVRAGGNPYILLTLTDPERGSIELLSQGFGAEQIIAGLREVADKLAEQLPEDD